jgi:hypothetical protein
MATRVCVLRLLHDSYVRNRRPDAFIGSKGSTSARAQPSGPAARSTGIIRASLWSRATNLPPIPPSLVAVQRPAHDLSVLRFMPASGPHPHSGHRTVLPNRQSAAPIQHESSRLAFKESAMDALNRAEQEPEAISIARCRELLGDDAATISDEEVLIVARHAESLAHIVIELALQDVRID